MTAGSFWLTWIINRWTGPFDARFNVAAVACDRQSTTATAKSLPAELIIYGLPVRAFHLVGQDADRLSAVLGFQLGHDAAQVCLDGALRDSELVGDEFVLHAAAQQVEQLRLTAREAHVGRNQTWSAFLGLQLIEHL